MFWSAMKDHFFKRGSNFISCFHGVFTLHSDWGGGKQTVCDWFACVSRALRQHNIFYCSSINLIKEFCFRYFLFIVVLWLTGLLLTYCSLSYSYDFSRNKSRLLNFIFLHTYMQPLFIHDIHSKLQVCTNYKLKIKMLKIINSRG